MRYAILPLPETTFFDTLDSFESSHVVIKSALLGPFAFSEARSLPGSVGLAVRAERF
ncbi:MAG TPA: hypothetical protein VK716_01090 [Terracidiphilus sp.]|nr:hypothetical protein [Terracidiphilus sp.]